MRLLPGKRLKRRETAGRYLSNSRRPFQQPGVPEIHHIILCVYASMYICLHNSLSVDTSAEAANLAETVLDLGRATATARSMTHPAGPVRRLRRGGCWG